MNLPSNGNGSGDAEDRNEPDVHSELFGDAADVVQARDIRGGVHFHRPAERTSSIPRQLPGDGGGFVNRLDDLARLDALLTSEEPAHAAPVCVIVGTAGVGKTSLAIHWARQVEERFPDGQLYVNLRGYDPGEPVAPEQALDYFLRALGVPPGLIPADVDARSALFRSSLANRRILVVLDNAATVSQVRPLLSGDARCLTLVTSRSRLSGLVSRDGAHRISLDILTEPEAIKLLHLTTGQYRQGDNEEDIAELARLCARLPLALRIAAERASARPQMPLQDLISALKDESALWSALSSEDDEELDAVRTVFAWSYRALTSDAARLFRLLGLHPGPEFSAYAAAALLGVPLAHARHLLDVLVGAHLLEQTTPTRYQFHDLLRAYAADQAAAEEPAEARLDAISRLLAWYLHTAQAAAPFVNQYHRLVSFSSDSYAIPSSGFADEMTAIQWFEFEWVNLRAAALAADRLGLDFFAWQLPLTLASYYSIRNSFDGRVEMANLALAAARRDGARLGEAEILHGLGITLSSSHQYRDAIVIYQRLLDVRREMGDVDGEARAVNSTGWSLMYLRDLEAARGKFVEAVSGFQRTGNIPLEALAAQNLGWANAELDRTEEAADALHRALQLHRDLNNKLGIADTLSYMAMVHFKRGEFEEALSSAAQSVQIAREVGSAVNEGYGLLVLAEIQQECGSASDALTSFQWCAVLHREQGDRVHEARAFDGIGLALRSMDRFSESADFHRRAITAFRELDQYWYLAISLDSLATALSLQRKIDEALVYWREALALISEFSDPAALKLRDRVQVAIAGIGEDETP
jgi:tetratricopeptide (TPR) repeat protein